MTLILSSTLFCPVRFLPHPRKLCTAQQVAFRPQDCLVNVLTASILNPRPSGCVTRLEYTAQSFTAVQLIEGSLLKILKTLSSMPDAVALQVLRSLGLASNPLDRAAALRFLPALTPSAKAVGAVQAMIGQVRVEGVGGGVRAWGLEAGRCAAKEVGTGGEGVLRVWGLKWGMHSQVQGVARCKVWLECSSPHCSSHCSSTLTRASISRIRESSRQEQRAVDCHMGLKAICISCISLLLHTSCLDLHASCLLICRAWGWHACPGQRHATSCLA